MTAAGKTLATIAFDPKRIEKRNAAFSRMSNQRKRMAIARDVLKQVEAKRYLAKSGCYVASRELTDLVYGKTENGVFVQQPVGLQEALLVPGPECFVCGLGSAFCSMARLEGGVKLGDKVNIHDALTPIFERNQIGLIEFAFEGCHSGSDIRLSSGEEVACVRFYEKYDDDEERLVCIFRNIIRNRGTFKPEQGRRASRT